MALAPAPMAVQPRAQSQLMKAPISPNTTWGTRIVIVGIVLPVVATIVTIGRIWARKMKGVKLWWDDWLIVVGLIAHCGHAATGITTVIEGGAGQDIHKLAPSVLVNANKALFAAQIGYALALGPIKASVCVLIIRIFNVDRKFKAVVWAVLVFAIAWALMVIGTALFDCHPIRYNWNKNVHGGCDNQAGAFVAVAATDILCDLAILLLPMPGVWKLQMPRTIKIALSVAFALGFVDIAIGILRVIATNNLDFDGNWSYQLGQVHFWSTMEPGLAIIVASSIVLRPVIERLAPSRLVSRASYHMRKNPSSAYSRVEEGSVPLKTFGGSEPGGPTLPLPAMLRGQGDTTPMTREELGGATADSWDPLSNELGQEHGSTVINVRKDISVHEETAR